MTLLIDNSNTRTKLMFSCDGQLQDELLVLPTVQVTAEALLKKLGKRDVSRILVASVVPRVAAEIRRAFGADVVFVSSENISDFVLDYPGCATLGADRIANVAGMVQLGRVPGIAVDLGTAATFDVVLSGDGCARFVGGVIAPGLTSMVHCLASETAQLPRIELPSAPKAIGRNTVEAMQSGCLYGYCGLVRGVLDSLSQEIGYKPYVVATGGDAALLSRFLPDIDCVEPRLTFLGLNALAAALF